MAKVPAGANRNKVREDQRREIKEKKRGQNEKFLDGVPERKSDVAMAAISAKRMRFNLLMRLAIAALARLGNESKRKIYCQSIKPKGRSILKAQGCEQDPCHHFAPKDIHQYKEIR